MNKIQKARSRLMVMQPFFASLVVSTILEWVKGLGTMATDMKKIYMDPEFVEALNADEIAFVLAHEVMHIVFMHGLRRGHRNHKLWNIACDFAINILLVDAKMTMPSGKYAGLLDEQYRGMSAEQIYDLLLEEAEKWKSMAMPGWSEDLREPANSNDPAAMAKLKREITRSVAAAAMTAKSIGKMPGNIEQLIDKLLGSQVSWRDLLREFATQTAKDEETWERRNRRFKIYLPTRHNEVMGEVVIINDNSGSRYRPQDHQQVAGEMQSICEQMRPERIRVFHADTKVNGEEVFEPGDPITLHMTGGGGTDMRVPLRHVEQFDPVVVVLITDGCTPWPNVEPPYPLIVVCTTDAKCPVGQVVRINEAA